MKRWAGMLVVGALLLVLVPGFGVKINGARRWVQLGPINFQPSELARLAVILWCAMLAAKKGEQVRQFKKGVLPFVVVLGFVSLLIVLQPNLSMATLIALLGGIVLFTAGAKIGHFLVLGFVAVLLVFQKIHDAQYRLARFTAFMASGDAPNTATSQIHQSFVGIGSGGVFGVGFGQGQQGFGYLPYAYSDFIFSSIGEEWGFIGVLLIVLLFALFCWLGFRIARTAEDPFGQYLATGLTAAAPSFFVAYFLQIAVIVFGANQVTGTRFLPVYGFGYDEHIVLPLLAVAIPAVAVTAQLTAARVSDVLDAEFITTANAKGLMQSWIMRVHVLPHALPVALEGLGSGLRISVASLPIVEYIFNWNGIGYVALQSIASRDPAALTASALVLVTLFALLSFIADLGRPRFAYR